MTRRISLVLIVLLIGLVAVPLLADGVDVGVKIGKDNIARFDYDTGHDNNVWMIAAILAAGTAIAAGLYFGLRDRRTHHPTA